MNARQQPLALALGATLLVALPGVAQDKGPDTQVWIDLATHHVAGMPDLGALGGLAGRMMGGKGPQGYPQSRNIPASQGQVLDIAMHNRLQPGTAAEQQVPAGLGVGKSLSLLPPASRGEHADSPRSGTMPEIEITIRQYWGCGATVRPGQPKVMTVRVKDGKAGIDGSLAPGLFVPDRDIDVNPGYALWPNPKNSKRVSDRSSMVGQHRITGAGVPGSLQFELGQDADFMAKIALETQGELADSIATGWQPVDRARAYFLTAMAMQDERNFVVWSSSEVAGAGNELINYLTGPYIDKWLTQKVLLSPSTTRCAIPQGIFKPTGKGGGEADGMAMLNLIAYGPETNIAWPPRPADPKQPWDPEWNVRVRTKSTTSAMLGMDFAGMSGMHDDAGADDGEQPPQEEEGKGKKLLRGLLRNF
ncbi:MAG TPA: hypothetical protein PK743_10735 [Luteimonas sp.]|nr:hypothetical protein [Luteimonas sp.]HRO26436.1 hypothetical protein [Luteimonas sp.]HRP73095.1 hypothetical protein [Luteimonas sp.]